MKRCPYCAEEIQDDAIKCRYCFSDLRVEPETAMRQGPEPSTTQGASVAAASGAAAGGPVTGGPVTGGSVGGGPAASGSPTSGPPGPDSVRYTHSGYRYVLGYGPDTFGIWDRDVPGTAAETFPRTDDGWRDAWIRFAALEPNNVPVDAAAGGTAPASVPASGTGPEPGDDQVLQYTHSGATYLLGYGRTFFGIWQRSDPTRPLERFPRDDAGWAAAWRRFTQIESNFAEVSLGSAGSTP